MPFTNETDAITYVFKSIANSNWRNRGLDEDTRDTTATQKLLTRRGLPAKKREYIVVTGSKGKGSASAITARLLQSLGYKVGLLTSPHLSTYRQRFRINGKMISEAYMIHLINELKGDIDAIQSTLKENAYLSPQGIFLAMALTWFDEQDVDVAVIEVGRGGRFDDNAIVPNMLSLFTPIILEHTRYMGSSIERIAWHKAGIIKPNSYAFSLPQAPEVMDILRTEAESKDATFEWLAPIDMGKLIEETEKGLKVDFGRYGVVDMPMMGHYEIDNASLAIWAAGNVHGRLKRNGELSHGSEEYVERIRHGLENVFWPGRCQKLQDNPAVYIDGAINTMSAEIFIKSVQNRLTSPVVTVLAVPKDRKYKDIYPLFAEISDSLVLTESPRNITIKFPDPMEALGIAKEHHDNVTYEPTVKQALDTAIEQAGENGTVLMAVAQPAIGDTMLIYDLDFEQI